MDEKNKVEVVSVVPTGKDRKVLLWERDEAHPEGEIFITNDGKGYKVAATAAVKRLLGDGSLEKVNWNSAVQETPVPAPTPGRRMGRPPKTVPQLEEAPLLEVDKE